MSDNKPKSIPGKTIDYGRVKDIALRHLSPLDLMSQLGDRYEKRAEKVKRSSRFSGILEAMLANNNAIPEPIILIREDQKSKAKTDNDTVFSVLSGFEYILAASGLDVPKIPVLIIKQDQSALMQIELNRLRKRQFVSADEDLEIQFAVHNYYDDV